MINLTGLITESRNPNTVHLDGMKPLDIVTVMNREDWNVVESVQAVLPQVAEIISQTTQCLEQGGRIIYMGAGTSGRLGLLDAVECPPTFGVTPETIMGVLAGGDKAFTEAVEGAEDSRELAVKELQERNLAPEDMVIGLAASGRTPYVIYGLRYARQLGCKTAAISCNPDAAISKEADISVEVVTGPEVLTGSTRLKAGTAQKMILNMISTGTMIGIGKVYENLMVDLIQSNKKLQSRAVNMVCQATACSEERASEILGQTEGVVKLAIVMILKNCNKEKAVQWLDEAHGHVGKTLK